MPSSCAGPEKTAPWPSTICVSVMPCAKAAPPRASAPAAISARIMISPSESLCDPSYNRLMAVRQGDAPLGLSAGEELAHLLHEALGAGGVAAPGPSVDLLQLAPGVPVPGGGAEPGLDPDLPEHGARVA